MRSTSEIAGRRRDHAWQRPARRCAASTADRLGAQGGGRWHLDVRL